MPFLKQIVRALVRPFRKRTLEAGLDAELHFHLEKQIELNLAEGMSADEARRRAMVALGGMQQTKETTLQQHWTHFLEILFRDARYALRMLRKSPGFTTVAMLTLALGIGANTSIFQLLNAVHLRTLPVKEPQELAEVRLTDTSDRRGSVNRFGQLTNPLWEQLRANQQAFSGMFAWGEQQFNLTQGGEGRYAKAMMVSGDFFNVLGVRPLLGRVLTPGDDHAGCGAPVAVISHSFWQREFGGDPAIIGRKLSLDSHPVEIVGVTQPDFFGIEVGKSYDVAAPICAEAVLRGENSRLTNGTMWWLVAVGRLNPGWSMKRASAHLDSISAGIFQATLPANYPAESMKHYLGFKLAAYPAGAGLSQLRNDYAGSLWLLLGASGLLLLIACANLANLMLARASAREREIVVRLALGASRGRLLHQLLMESLLLAALGSLLGLWIARALSGVLISFLSINGDPVFLDLNLDWRVLGFNAGLAALTCLLFGMTSALRATGAEPGLALKTGAHTVTAGRERFSLRRILVVSQVSLSLVLLAGALLFSRSLRNLMTLDIGFRQNGVLLAGLDFTSLHLPAERRLEFKRQLLDRIRAIPGTKAAATLDIIPITGDSWSHDVWMDGPSSPQRLEVLFNRVSPDFFRTLEIPLVAGRTFDQEIAGGTKTAIVNEAFAQQLTNGANPVGKRFWREQTPSQPQALYEIVGLVKNTKYLDLREDFRPIVYLASSQDPSPDSSARVVLRSDLPPADITASVRRTVAEVNPGIVIDFDNLQTVIQGSLQRERLITTLSDFFGVLAVLLATMGLYGVISYIVARRTNEIGIRMALGADRTSVLRLIMREAVVLLVIGLGLGTTSALLAAKAAGNLLFGLKTNDPATFIMAAASLTLVTLAAGYFPAHRATKVDPMVALRQQ